MLLPHSSKDGSVGDRSDRRIKRYRMLREKVMKTLHNLAAVSMVLVLVCCGALLLNQKVSAAGEGKITGTVKLGTTDDKGVRPSDHNFIEATLTLN